MNIKTSENIELKVRRISLSLCLSSTYSRFFSLQDKWRWIEVRTFFSLRLPPPIHCNILPNLSFSVIGREEEDEDVEDEEDEEDDDNDDDDDDDDDEETH